VLDLAAFLRWPVMADPRSGCRLPGTIAAADAIVRTGPPLPKTAVVLGTPWLSRALGEYLSAAADAGSRVVVVDPYWQWRDPARVATEFHQVSVEAWLAAARDGAVPAEAAWLEGWLAREDLAQGGLEKALGTDMSEPLVARAVHDHATRAGATLMVSSSMPIRDLEWFAPAVSRPPRVLANRGANGIDGIVSTALGVAATGGPVVALLGDLAFLHDVSGLVDVPELPCAFVVVDNNGGGIFSFLPQATALDEDTFERLFGTAPMSDVTEVARGFGLEVREAASAGELDDALAWSASSSRPVMIRARVPGRAANVALHDKLNQAVRLALS
jgi:2-succinyl-5-enolpyruvyl-6-hydroxy-3-cyclohexene-1-carboxylate synthase